MSSSTAVHSNAFNFRSYVEHGVDPRTGQYTVALSVPDLKSHALAGPALPLSISFSPMNTRDAGFGLGWAINLTEYSPHNDMLSLGTGETYKVTGTGATPSIAEKKLDSFRFYKDSDTHYRVVHRPGLVEVLKVFGGSTPLALPEQILGPDGRGLQLTYVTFQGGERLSTVSDDSGELLRIERTDTRVELRFYPGQGADGAPLATFVMHLDGSNRVTRVVLPTQEQACWRLAYEKVREITCLKEVWTPTGAHETMEYLDQGHLFPNDAHPALPRVTRHEVDPGQSQPPMVVEYSYTPENFLGHGELTGWNDDGLDNLYRVARASFRYGSTAVHVNEDGDNRVVERSYNRFHLLTDEITRQGRFRKHTATCYYADLPEYINESFANQPHQCQLPRRVETSWEIDDDATRRRSDIIETEFDEHCNLTRQVNADGTREENTYYPAAGDGALCPKDPEGFTRSLRTKTEYPATSAHGSAPTLRRNYQYIAVPSLPGTHSKPHLAESVEILEEVGKGELLRTQTEYFDDPADTLRLGREKVLTETRNGKATVTDRQYATHHNARLGAFTLQVIETVTGFDGTHRAITQEHSLLNGEPLLVQDEDGVEIRYTYDALARVTLETVSPDNPEFEASREYIYHLAGGDDGDQAWQVMTDVKRVQTRTWMDGLARPVLEERQDVDTADDEGRDRAEAPFRATYRALHNGLGELVQESQIDWLRKIDLELKTGYGYDNWGQRTSTTRPDGVVEWEVLDPIGSPDAPHGVRRTWLEASDGALSGVTESWLDRFDKEIRIERFDIEGKSVSVVRNHHDGLGRLAEQIDPRSRSTTYLYDAFDRQLETTLPGGAVVARRYAEHSIEDLPIHISVDEVELGTQKFDGLDRMTEATTAKRRRLLHYEGGRERPSKVVTPSERVILYEYQPQLGEEVEIRRMPDAVSTYGYDHQNSRLTHCDEEGNALTRTYYSNGQLRTETRQRDGGGEDVAEFGYSLRGRMLDYTTLGMSQSCTYDAAGRVDVATQGSTTATFAYDTFGRVYTVTSVDGSDGNRLKVTIHYDDFGRETWREFDANGAKRELTLTYDAADALDTRILTESDTVVRSEGFFYDVRGRLLRHECTGTELPQDAWGHAFTRQVFLSDALDNLTSIRTFLEGGAQNLTTYHYHPTNPVQLDRITNDLEGYPQEITLSYDRDGNITRDEQGRELVYDPLGRLVSVSASGTLAERSYRFDALDVLVGTSADGINERRFYLDDTLVARAEGANASLYLRADGRVLAEQMRGVDSGTVLLATDQSNTVLREVRQGAEQDVRYTAYGFPSGGPLWTGLAYNGEFHEPEHGVQLLGAGYRAYSPVLMRFLSTDSESPFGEGGFNPYGYVINDPVNHVDPTGNVALWALSLVLGGAAVAGGFFVKNDALQMALFTIGGSLITVGGLMGVKAYRGQRFGRGGSSSRSSASSQASSATAYDFSSPQHMQRRGAVFAGGSSRGPDPAFAQPAPARSNTYESIRSATEPTSITGSGSELSSIRSGPSVNSQTTFPPKAIRDVTPAKPTSSATWVRPKRAPAPNSTAAESNRRIRDWAAQTTGPRRNPMVPAERIQNPRRSYSPMS
ncbi:RHS repeat domain-containing protein [Stenotrophomonas sp. 22385]|uniref:RHS repeat domain-containing protein n=1 Tax=Stenotrophomonas sp. 22385 TaxID=3453915 RepID=UPI003F83B560